MAEAAVVPAGVGVGAAVALGRQMLAGAGCETPRLDAELLLASALGVGRERLVIDRDKALDGADCDRYEALLARRRAREPVAYILGYRDFRHLRLAVDRRVLIPRPESELLVEVGLALPAGARVLDVGTGSGAVALAVKHERPDLVVCGMDVSRDALDVARDNAIVLGLDVRFAQGDLLTDLGPAVAFDAVLANLPYVSDDAVLAPEISGHEPSGALFAGPDGLDLVRRLIAQVGALSSLPALLGLEIGPDQAREVTGLVRGAGFARVDVLSDLAGLARAVVGTS